MDNADSHARSAAANRRIFAALQKGAAEEARREAEAHVREAARDAAIILGE